MSIVEYFVLIVIVLVLSWLLRPVQKWLEHRIFKFLKNSKGQRGPIIDVTDSVKKDKK